MVSPTIIKVLYLLIAVGSTYSSSKLIVVNRYKLIGMQCFFGFQPTLLGGYMLSPFTFLTNA